MREIERDIVGAFIFSSDDRTLLGQSTKGGVYQDQWCVAGGGIEPNETKEEAVRREIAEELTLDLSPAKLHLLEKASTGESEKVLRDSGEKVLVKMTLYNYVAQFSMPAAEISYKASDDLGRARWFTRAELKKAVLGPATAGVLAELGWL